MPGRRLVAATAVTKSHIPLVRVLAESLRRHEPELELVLLLCDEPDGRFDPAAEPFETITFADSDAPGLRRAISLVGKAGVAPLAKPLVIRHLHSRGCDVLLLDADIMAFASLDPLREAIGRSSIVLTPHLLEPASTPNALDREHNILFSGIFNTGVVGVACDDEGRRFVDWWAERMIENAGVYRGRGVWHDQRWADLVPVMFDRVQLLRDPGVNAAYWNAAERPLARAGDGWTVAGEPLRLWHYSGFDPRRPEQVTRFWPDFRAAEFGDGDDMFAAYAQALLRAGWEEAASWPWAFEG